LIVDKQILQKIHVPALVNMVAQKLNVTFNKMMFDLTLPEPFSIHDILKVNTFVNYSKVSVEVS
jgi:hypothetical protein